jgi:vacuolar-type H+-ATPase subunit H
MTTHTRRYVFLDFDTLLNIKFKKLEKVCDKIFVFVGFEITDVPFLLVRDMQSMGNAIKWVEVSATLTHDLNYHICFLMGKLHEKISGDVEFAILSNDVAFDPLVNFINATGRNCVRIKTSATEKQAASPKVETSAVEDVDNMPNLQNKNVADAKPTQQSVLDGLNTRLFGEHSSETDDQDRTQANSEHTLIEETAQETVRRLVRSGNRPQSVTMLRNYILLHNQELSLHGDVDKIINRLNDSKEIELANGGVQYNF